MKRLLALLWAGSLCALAIAPSAPGQATTNPAPSATPAATGSVAPAQRGWWNQTVFYEVFVRSFFDSRDGPLAGDGEGDLRGLNTKLDYLNDGNASTNTDLGVTGIWLMPIHPSPSYHGYDATDYFGTNPDYGTLDDFKSLTASCRRRGISVIIDLVMNHHSDKHEWFKRAIDPASAFHDWYLWADTAPEYKGPWNQTVWHPLRRGQSGGPFYYGLFGRDMPDLNYDNAEVSKQMKAVARFWLEEMGIDGFRLDAIRHLIEDGQVQDNTSQTHAWLKEFGAFCRGIRPHVFLVGEVWADAAVSASYVGDELTSSFNFELADRVVSAVKRGDAAGLREGLERTARLYPRGQDSTFLANHDQPRLMTQLGGDVPAARLAATLLLTLSGIPFLYYGEEIGMRGDKPDPDIRTPMRWSDQINAGFSSGKPWRSANADAATVNVAAQSGDAGSLLSHYRRLIRLRADHAALRDGDQVLLDTGSPAVLGVLRRGGGESVLILVNLSSKPVKGCGVTLPTDPTSFTAASELLGTKVAEPKGPRYQPVQELPPRGSLIISLR